MSLPNNSNRRATSSSNDNEETLLLQPPPSLERPSLSGCTLWALTICMAGMQFVWTVEFSYGTPYLLSLGLSKPLMSLVWLAGPLSGLVIQPLIGTYSDVCTSPLGRRRPYILVGSVLVLLSIFSVAYAKWLSSLCLSLIGQDQSDNENTAKNMAIFIAIAGFYVLDFSINIVQACCRALVIDVAPLEQQSQANGWVSRMIGFGSLFSYFTGFLDLVALFPGLGKTQMEVLCTIASAVFAFCVGCTCLFTHEEKYVRGLDNVPSFWYTPLIDVFRAIRRLPNPVRRICHAQFFAWMAWFPFMFYSTSWVIEILMRDHSPSEPGFFDAATRAGSLALLLYSIVSLLCSIILPMFTSRAESATVHRRRRLARTNLEHPNRFYQIVEACVDAVIACWRLRGIWTISNLILAAALLLTLFARNVKDAAIILAICGLPWAVAMWAPFAMIGEHVSAMTEEETIFEADNDSLPSSPAARGPSGYRTLQSQPNDDTISGREVEDGISPQSDLSRQNREDRPSEVVEAGTAIGIHNIYVVMPQFASILVSTVIFSVLQTPPSSDHFDPGNGNEWPRNENEPIGWVLRFGGLCALIAALLASRCRQPDHHFA